MTIFEYVIAREANRLGEESRKRELTEAERRLFYALAPTLRRLESEEALKTYASRDRGTPLSLSCSIERA